MPIPSLHLSEFASVEMDFTDEAWRGIIPGGPGWYAIETDAPISALAQVPLPLDLGSHYPIAQRVRDSQFLIESGAAIVPNKDGASYIVYSGEHGNLKARAREHVRGHLSTGCLALSRYEIATKFRWRFHYRPCDAQVPAAAGNKMLRNYLEQKWRAENGWPVLCARCLFVGDLNMRYCLWSGRSSRSRRARDSVANRFQLEMPLKSKAWRNGKVDGHPTEQQPIPYSNLKFL